MSATMHHPTTNMPKVGRGRECPMPIIIAVLCSTFKEFVSKDINI
jgi:hypothetical protein